ncbi:MAG: hypothetical protein K8L97_19590 [Anaerolineae bacterium]|nr:hypothetical protein [Anaerolineae bacterium]
MSKLVGVGILCLFLTYPASQDTNSAIPELQAITPENVTQITQIALLPEDSEFFSAVAFSPDSKQLAVVSDEQLILWNLESWTIEWRTYLGEFAEYIRQLEFSPDGRLLVLNGGGFHWMNPTVWDVETGTRPFELHIEKHPYDFIGDMFFSADGFQLVVAFGTVFGTMSWDMNTGNILKEGDRLSDPAGDLTITGVRFSLDGQLRAEILGGPLGNGQFSIAGLEERISFRPEIDIATSLVFSPDNKELLIGGYSLNTDKVIEHLIIWWDIATNTEHRHIIYRTHDHYEISFSNVLFFSPSGSLLVFNDMANAILFCDPQTGDLLSTVFGHTNLVASMDFSADERMIASASYDGTVRLWGVPFN